MKSAAGPYVPEMLACVAPILMAPVIASASTFPTHSPTPFFYGVPRALEWEMVKSDTSGPISVEEIASLIRVHLGLSIGLRPDRISQTSDGSILLQFLRQRTACVDVYPSGDVVVIVRNGETDNIYELACHELKEIAGLLKNGRIPV